MASSLVAIVLGIFLAIQLSGFVKTFLEGRLDVSPGILPIISFTLIFIVVVLIIYIAAFFVDKLLKAIALGFINRLIGALFGMLVNAFILSVIICVLISFDHHRKFLPKEDIADSYLYAPVSKIAPFIFPFLHFDKLKLPPVNEHFTKKEE